MTTRSRLLLAAILAVTCARPALRPPTPAAVPGGQREGAQEAEPAEGNGALRVLPGHPEARPASRPTAEQLEASRARFRQGVASVAFEVQVRPPGRTEIAGLVHDRDGRPVRRACVELVAGGGARTPAPVFSSPTGYFRFAGVPSGPARVTITVESRALVASKRIADYHDQDPDLTVLLRPIVLLPAAGLLTVPRIKRQSNVSGPDGTQFVEVAATALDLEGYSARCRRAQRLAR